MENGTLIHYLNGVQCEEPTGWIDFTEEIERNFDQRILATQYPIEVTFTGGAFATLRDMFIEDFCASVVYEVDFVCGNTFRVVRGVLSLGEVEWNLNKCTANVKVQDDGYGARIFNNKEIGVYPTATLTKNSEALTPVTAIDLEVFDPTAAIGVYLTDTRKAYDWMDCMEHIVQYITDGEVTAQSQWYQDLPEEEKYALLYGRELRVADGTSLAPQMSFEDLFSNAWKKYNLWAYVERSSTGDPVLRIEEEADTYTDTQVIAFPHQDDLEQSIDSKLLYAKVEIGSDTYIKDEDGAFALPFLTMQGFVKEEYHLEGTCNTDATLDLVSSFVIDTNVIQDCCINNNDEHDEEVFMIQYSPYQQRATKSDYLIPGSIPYLYNEQILNINVANRWRLQASGVQNISAQDLAFRAERTIGPGTLWSQTGFNDGVVYTIAAQQMLFDNDYTAPNFDTTNNWGNGTIQGNPVSQANSRYTAASTGLYGFTDHVLYRWVFGYSGGAFDSADILFNFYVFLQVFDAANVFLGQDQFTSTISFHADGPALWDINNVIDASQIRYLFGGNYVRIMVDADMVVSNQSVPTVGSSAFLDLTLPVGSTIETDFVAVGGGVLVDADPDEYRATVYTFDRSSTTEDWVGLRDNPIDMVSVATDASSFRNGHVLKASRHIATGETEWILIANRDQAFK